MISNQDDLLADPIEVSSGGEPMGRYGRYVLPTGPGKAREHMSPSTLGKSLEDGYGLGVWRARRIAWAIATRPDLALKLSSISLAELDKSDDAKEVMAAAELVGAIDEGSNLGTAIHNVLQRVDQGEPDSAFHPYFAPIIANYRAALAAAGLIVIPELIERVVLCSRYGCAGKFDNIMAEADGTLVLVDKKSERDPTDGPQSICTQLGTYANSDQMMNYETGQFEAMPVVRKDYAIVIHIDRETFEVKIHRFDIERGWASARLAWEKREWNKAKHLCHPYISNGQWVPQPNGGPTTPEVQPATNGQPTRSEAVYAAVDAAVTQGPMTPERVADLNAQVKPAPYPQYETPAEVEHAPVQDQLARGGIAVDPSTRVQEIMDVRRNDKTRLQQWAKTLGCTDLAHHRKWLAEWIVAATPGSGAVEPSGEADAGASQVRHPQTMAEAGFTGPVPASPPGVAVIGPQAAVQPDAGNDFSTAAIVQEIITAPDMDRIMSIWQRVVGALGQGGWSGEIKAAADARVAVLRAPVQPAGPGGLPY